MDWLLAQDESLLVAINGSHSPFGDLLMTLLSNKLVWIPGYLALAYWLSRIYPRNAFLLALVVAIPVILLADQSASGILKPWVARPRPCHVPELAGILHLVDNHCGGPYGFASSHASNFFALATYLGWHFRRRMPWMPYLLFGIAGMVGFSRIYLGVHYPGDVLAGMLLGIFSGLVGILLFRLVFKKLNFPQTANKTNVGRS